MNQVNAIDAIVVQVEINASAHRVFEALTDPKQRVQWWGAKGKFQVTHMESDLRVGGAWLMSGVGGDNRPFTLRGEYTAIERPRVLEFTWQPDWNEPQTLVRFDLEENNGATTVRVTHSGFAAAASRERYEGWPWLLSMLREHVTSSATS
jgi:uncharacterized protein YndB with AHSA1/START domain